LGFSDALGLRRHAGHAAFSFAGSLALAALLLSAPGCVGAKRTTEWSSPMGKGPVSETHALEDYGAAKQLAQARRMVKGGQYSLAIPRLQQIVTQFPADAAGIEARHHLGVAYYMVGEYQQALDHFNQHLSMAPEGAFSGESREYVAKLTQQDAAPAEKKGESDLKVTELEAAFAAHPDDMSAGLELAALRWDRSEYPQAGDVYRRLLARWPGLEQDTLVRTRMAKEADGSWTVLDPVEAERRFRQAEPLRIFNVASFRSGRYSGWQAVAQQRDYNVSGQAVNVGDTPLQDVRVMVTIYGLGQLVYDTQTVALGALQPGEVRAFSVQFTRFDDINNIVRHECRGTFRR